jgi:hypothetical protein
MLIVSPSVEWAAFADSVGVAWLDPTSPEGNVRSSCVGAWIAMSMAVTVAAAH